MSCTATRPFIRVTGEQSIHDLQKHVDKQYTSIHEWFRDMHIHVSKPVTAGFLTPNYFASGPTVRSFIGPASFHSI